MLDVRDREIDLNYDNDAYDEPVDTDDDAFEPYRSVSKPAVISVLLAVCSLAGLLFPALLFLAFVGLGCGILATRNLKRYPDELSGKGLALFGTIACVVVFVGGAAMHTYVYLTEVPEGYQRISFVELQVEDDAPAMDGSNLPHELNGKRVFVKGYVHPGVASVGLVKKFIIVPDMGTCCFGGQPKYTDMIEVTVVDSPGLKYNRRKRKLGGIFKVQNQLQNVAGGLQGGYYELEADYVK